MEKGEGRKLVARVDSLVVTKLWWMVMQWTHRKR